jgi:hypothetical protein
MKLTISLIAVSIVLAGAALSQEPPPTHEEMQAEVKTMDERLDKLVIDMNTAATPEKKLDATIAVLNEMVAQHKKMRERAMQHMEEMHRHGPDAHKMEGHKQE